MPNKRISDLAETHSLTSNGLQYPFRSSAVLTSSEDQDALFLLARSGSHNEKIKYKNFKSSVSDNAVFLTGDQLISGRKTFADDCTFLSTTKINEIIDITQKGDISGNIFVGETGLFQHMGVGDKFFLREDDVNKTLEVDGDSFFHGSVEITGDAYRNGPEHHLEGDSEYIGNIDLIGNQLQKGNFDILGDSRRAGGIEQTGDAFFHSELVVHGDIKLGKFLFPHQDISQYQFFEKASEDSITTFFAESPNKVADPSKLTFLKFTPDLVELKASAEPKESNIRWFEETEDGSMIMEDSQYSLDASNKIWEYQSGSGITHIESGQFQGGTSSSIVLDNNSDKSIKFYVDENEEAISITESGSFGVNSEDPFAQLSMSGDAYITHVDTYIYGEWRHVYPGEEDETIYHSIGLPEGKDSYLINFPKTFVGSPVLSVSVKHDKGGVIIPFMISGLTDSQYNINFTKKLPDNQYKVNTIAMSTGKATENCFKRAMDTEKIQRFKTPVTPGLLSYHIPFPSGFESPPTISTTIEGEEKFPPHFISGVTTGGYNIVFGTELQDPYKIHTTASMAGIISRCQPNHTH